MIYGDGEFPENKEALRTITTKLIEPKVLSEFTWTGKAKGARKNAFKSYAGIIDVLFNMIKDKDKNFTTKKFAKIMTYDILKYAYKFDEKSTAEHAH